jgi:hypothetical protein
MSLCIIVRFGEHLAPEVSEESGVVSQSERTSKNIIKIERGITFFKLRIVGKLEMTAQTFSEKTTLGELLSSLSLLIIQLKH